VIWTLTQKQIPRSNKKLNLLSVNKIYFRHVQNIAVTFSTFWKSASGRQILIFISRHAKWVIFGNFLSKALLRFLMLTTLSGSSYMPIFWQIFRQFRNTCKTNINQCFHFTFCACCFQKLNYTLKQSVCNPTNVHFYIIF